MPRYGLMGTDTHAAKTQGAQEGPRGRDGSQRLRMDENQTAAAG